jgi:hypothetical protein
MKLEKFKEESYEFSKQASDLVRQFAFAGIAIIWIFKIDKPTEHLIPQELFKPLLFFVVTLIFDIFQYLIPAIILSIFFWFHERKNQGNTQIDKKAPFLISLPGWLCFFGKVTSLFIGFYYITIYLFSKV